MLREKTLISIQRDRLAEQLRKVNLMQEGGQQQVVVGSPSAGQQQQEVGGSAAGWRNDLWMGICLDGHLLARVSAAPHGDGVHFRGG